MAPGVLSGLSAATQTAQTQAKPQGIFGKLLSLLRG